MTKRFIVTGGAGLIGSNLVHALNARGHEDIVIVDHLNHPAKQNHLDRLSYAEYIDKSHFRDLLRSGRVSPADTLFHLGACSSTSETNTAYLDDNNVAYSRDLCLWASDHGVRFIYASSAATYGDGALGYDDSHDLARRLQPLNPYGQSKQDFDLWALDNGHLSAAVGIKYFNVYGPGEEHKGEMRSLVNKAFGWIRDTGKLGLFKSYRPEFDHGEQKRDFIYVNDAVRVTLFFHDHPQLAGLYNCGTGEPRTWLDLGRAVFAAMRREPDIHFIDMPEAMRPRYQYFTKANTAKLRAAGYAAAFTSLEDGIADYVCNHLR